jgi:tRNA(Ile)-lysidine synthase
MSQRRGSALFVDRQPSNQMTAISERVSEFMLEHAMLEGSRGAIVAVSGGPDSVAVLDILVRLFDTTSAATARRAARSVPGPRPQFGTRPGFALTVAHLNHKLRAQAADDDARFVSELAVRLGLPAVVGVADVNAIAATLKMSVEEAARAARYSFLFQATRLSQADRIITGHTMNDQVETFVMRAVRGSGTAGLAGMAPVRPAHQFDGIPITMQFQGARPPSGPTSPPTSVEVPLLIRPALCVTREEVEQYCRERSISFRVDASNLSGDFTRNRIRHEVIPGLCRVEPQAIQSIARAMDILGADNQALEELAGRALDVVSESADAASQHLVRRHRKLPSTGDASAQTSAIALGIDALAGQPRAIVNRVILQALRNFLTPGAEINSTHISAVESLIRHGRSGKHLELPGNIRVWRDGRTLVIDKASPSPPLEVELTCAPGVIRAGGFLITLERNLPGALFEEIIGRARSQKARTGQDWKMAVLDESLVPDPLVVRTRRPGERVLVIGQSGLIKLKNLMINHKIPVSRRASWPLASTRDGRYVWSPGLPPSVNFAANRETRSLAVLSATDD